MTKLDFAQVKRFALVQLNGRWLLPVVIQLITMIVTSAFYFPVVAPMLGDGSFEQAVVAAEKPLPLISMTVYLLVVRVFFVAEVEVYAALTQGPERIAFSKFFEGFSDWWRAVKVTLWKGLFLYLWTLLFFVPAVIKFYSYYFAEYIVAEFPAVSPLAAVGISRRITIGAKWRLFLLDLTLLPWVLLALFTGVGMLWAMPFVRMTHINAFHALMKGAIEDGRVGINELGVQGVSNQQDGA